ncbi:dTMP kinase [Sphingomonas lycopersici]|uniref:Thymidylate kinase n=1 Tax=Sphingomonas lycopersici TaxID=2951807 RepID=A0AA41ZCX3_9SPHN|nr:dTMP kinase [Sphingomonas lycopersici]MCW6529437.1 dTMP kinase [Sphingomonas lycopersici]MCW6537715.1 dTMP kinase [Sphingomonas lycopersici]
MIGRFLSLEGGEGAGKSTQVRALAAALEARGIPTLVTREPGGSEGAEAIRGLLMQGDVQRWSAHTEALLFAAARADHVEKTIRPAIGAGTWVISDRYIDSTRAYQGVAGGIDDAAILALHAFGSRGLLPDRTFVLELPPAEGARRAAGRDGSGADRFALRDENFHVAVAEAFDRFARVEPDRFRRVDATRPPAEVTAALLDGLADLLP